MPNNNTLKSLTNRQPLSNSLDFSNVLHYMVVKCHNATFSLIKIYALHMYVYSCDNELP